MTVAYVCTNIYIMLSRAAAASYVCEIAKDLCVGCTTNVFAVEFGETIDRNDINICIYVVDDDGPFSLEDSKTTIYLTSIEGSNVCNETLRILTNVQQHFSNWIQMQTQVHALYVMGIA